MLRSKKEDVKPPLAHTPPVCAASVSPGEFARPWLREADDARFTAKGAQQRPISKRQSRVLFISCVFNFHIFNHLTYLSYSCISPIILLSDIFENLSHRFSPGTFTFIGVIMDYELVFSRALSVGTFWGQIPLEGCYTCFYQARSTGIWKPLLRQIP